MLPMMFGVAINYVIGSRSTVLIMDMGLNAITYVLRYTYGCGCEFSDLYPQIEGPYKVGYGRLRTKRYGTELFIWYPVSKVVHE